MFVICLFIYSICSKNEIDDCTSRTKIFDAKGNNNTNNYYFAANTFSANSLLSINRVQFRSKIISRMKCIGQWCDKTGTNAGWRCINNTNECYHVEHIIPTANNIESLVGCCGNNNGCDIEGNLIMSYGKWNMQLGNSFIGEKYIVYGDILKKAYNAVYLKCKGSKYHSTQYPGDLCIITNHISLDTLVIAMAAVIFLMVLVGIFAYAMY